MDVSKLSTRVEEYNSEFSDFELNRKMMIMKATTLKEECTATIRDIEDRIKQLNTEKEKAQAKLTELEELLSKL